MVIASLLTTQITRSSRSLVSVALAIGSRELSRGAEVDAGGLGASAGASLRPTSGIQLGMDEQPERRRGNRIESSGAAARRTLTGASPAASRERPAPRARARPESALPPCTPFS